MTILRDEVDRYDDMVAATALEEDEDPDSERKCTF